MYRYEVKEVLNMATGKKRWYVNGKRATQAKAEYVAHVATTSGICDCYTAWEKQGRAYYSKQCHTHFRII